MAKKQTEAKPYGLHPMFETIVAELSSSRPSFWGRVGHEIDPERISNKTAALFLRACKAIASDGHPPSTPILVLQRINSWHEQGKVDRKQLRAAQRLCEAALEDASAFNEEEIIAELAPKLRHDLEKKALEMGMDAFGKHGDQEQTSKLLARAKRIGLSNVSTGTRVTAAGVPQMAARTSMERISTGIDELDLEIGGGVKRGTMTIVTGSTGVGKSFFLDHFVANAISSKEPSAIATLELNEDDHYSRIVGNLTDLPYMDVVTYEEVTELANSRMMDLEQDGMLAFCSLKYFTPGAATVADIEEWLKAEEMMSGIRFTVLGVDYASLLAAAKPKARHEELGDIAKDLRAMAVRRNLWLVSPNQANAEGMDPKKTKTLQNHHSADSKAIPKNADLHITMNPRDDDTAILYHVAKHRHGKQHGDAGPIPHDFDRGRLCHLQRRGFVW